MTITRSAALSALLLPALFAQSQDADREKREVQPTHHLVPIDLPWLDGAPADEPTLPRAVVEVHADGSVRVEGGEPIEADDEEIWNKVKSRLHEAIATWDKEELDTVLPIEVHKGRILFRCDASAPFRAVQKVMETGAGVGIMIPGYDFACRDVKAAEAALAKGDAVPGPTDELAASLAYDLPTDLDHAIEESVDAAPSELGIEILIRVRAEGARVDTATGRAWVPGRGRTFSYASDRQLNYSIGPKRFTEFELVLEELEKAARWQRRDHPKETLRAVIDARSGTTYGEVLAIFHAMQSAKMVDRIAFVGSYE